MMYGMSRAIRFNKFSLSLNLLKSKMPVGCSHISVQAVSCLETILLGNKHYTWWWWWGYRSVTAW